MGKALGGVGRTPGQRPRSRRNWDRLGGDAKLIDSANAIQLSVAGKIILVIATGQPFTQTAAGLALTVATSDFLSVTGSSLTLDDDAILNQAVFYGAFPVGEAAI